MNSITYSELKASGIPLKVFADKCGGVNVHDWKTRGIPKKYIPVCTKLIETGVHVGNPLQAATQQGPKCSRNRNASVQPVTNVLKTSISPPTFQEAWIQLKACELITAQVVEMLDFCLTWKAPDGEVQS